MHALRIVEVHVFSQKTTEVAFVNRDNMVKKVALHSPDPPFGDAVLPRRPKSRPLWFDTKARNRSVNLLREYCF